MIDTTLYKVTSCMPTKRGNYKVTFSCLASDGIELSVHEELVVEYRLVVDKELDITTFEQLQNDLGYGKAYAYAVGILSRRMYTEKEIREKLLARATQPDQVQVVIQKLLETELLNDRLYAEYYIESQVDAGKKSKERIVMDLYQKGVDRYIVEDFEHLFDSDQEKEIIDREIANAWRRYAKKELTDFERRAKIVQSVARKGFDVDAILCQYEIFVDER